MFDAVVSTVEGLPRARRRDPDALAESVRRAVRGDDQRALGQEAALLRSCAGSLIIQGEVRCWAGSITWRSRSRMPKKPHKIYGKAFGADISEAVPLPEHGVITVFVTLPNTKIEFIQPLGEASPIAKFVERNADGGIHHVCYDVPDIIAARDRMICGGRAGARRRPAEDRRPRQAGAVLPPQGFFRRACRDRTGLRLAYAISTAFAIYFVLWWVVLFLTLPFGVRSQHEDGDSLYGTDPGAPIMARMGAQADLDDGDLGGHFRHRLCGPIRPAIFPSNGCRS